MAGRKAREKFTIKQGDTRPFLVATLYEEYRDPADDKIKTRPVDLTNATEVRLHVFDKDDGTLYVDEAVNIVEPTVGGVRFENWTTTHTQETGKHFGEFQVTFNDGGIRTFPNDKRGFFVVVTTQGN